MKIKINQIFYKKYSLWFVFSIFLHTGNTALAANKIAEVNHSSRPVFLAVDLNRDGHIDREFAQIKPADLAAGIKPNDVTTPELPYRFWINNDLDVVNNSGSVTWEDNCGSGGLIEHQICEEWDENPKNIGRSNTSDDYVIRFIETDRDLEDFAPLLMHIPKGFNYKDYTIILRAVNVSINLFKSDWDDEAENVAHKYIFDEVATRAQMATANSDFGHFTTVMKAGKEEKIDEYEVGKFFNSDGDAKFIFEGIAASPEICSTNAENCYLELELSKKEGDKLVSIAKNRLYMDLHDIKDYYKHVTAGTAQPAGSTDAFNAVYRGGYTTKHDRKLDIYKGLFTEQEIKKDLTVLVHGWRMRDFEKISFADTSFKRLYWSGYKNQFATFSWPTGWFNKPAHAYDLSVLPYVTPNMTNYDISDVVARQVGKDFRGWASSISGQELHVIAHSMGNVVVSEALNYSGTEYLLSSYTASQAATGAGSYDSNSRDVQHDSYGCLFSTTPEDMWRCYNIDNELNVGDTVYDMPPDMYRNNFVTDDGQGHIAIKHGPTSSSSMGPNTNGNHYFKDIATHVGRILNFYNPQDAALTAWEFNQLLKPDYADSSDSDVDLTWKYTNTYLQAYYAYEECVDRYGLYYEGECEEKKPVLPAEVTSVFLLNDVDVPYNEENKFRILGFVIPARTEPLGQIETEGEIDFNKLMLGFTASNQDHSAPFHGYLSQTSHGGSFRKRAMYWNSVLTLSLGKEPGGAGLTGLYNGITK